jgi:hypothetical protein
MKSENNSLRLLLEGVGADDQAPKVAVYLVDRAGKLIGRAEVDEKGGFQLDPKALASANLVQVGPADTKFEELQTEALLSYRPGALAEVLRSGDLVIPQDKWRSWACLSRYRCVQGNVKRCRPAWQWWDEVFKAALPTKSKFAGTLARESSVAQATFNPGAVASATLHVPVTCAPVCDGIVEVYRRTCCRWPIIFDDPHIPILIDELENLIPIPQDIPWPPVPPGPWPGPDPGPYRLSGLVKEGALDQKVLNAARDVAALRTLNKFEQVAYLEARPYLWTWDCGPATKVGTGYLQPGGDFNVCWSECLYFTLPNCHEEFAFKVRQVINGVPVTIYDGLAAGEWFAAGTPIKLVSYHPQAVTCNQDDGPHEGGAFVLLQDIGLAHSYRLKTPDATGWDRVAPATYNDGLLDPAVSTTAALGNYLNSNWGGTLMLRYKFSESLKAAGGKYYRISVRPTDATGLPTGAPQYFVNGHSWLYYEVVGTDIFVRSASLGPAPHGAEDHLYEIPYNADHDWLSGQYHGWVDTAGFVEGRYLITVEIFDAAGQRLRPVNVPPGEVGLGVPAGFTFRRWFQEVGPTAEVPFAALSHMFWWDNRKTTARIEALRHGNTESSDECQFISGCASDLFSISYRAYHPEPMFQLNHSITWVRGLNGGSGDLTPGIPARYQNAGQPPNPPAISGTDTLGHMLAGHPKCSFAVDLNVYAKTNNGFGRLSAYDALAQAAFALEQVFCPDLLQAPVKVPSAVAVPA